ncbi:nitric oxide synthase oxygenase, partial [Staphylococcus warneri]
MLIDKATTFIQTMYSELNYTQDEIDKRLKDINQEIEKTGTYTHTLEELT